jgi:hypothetical protein
MTSGGVKAETMSAMDVDASAAAPASSAAPSASPAPSASSDPASTAAAASSPTAAAAAAAVGDAPVTRDEYAKTEEDKGIITFPVVCNDGLPDHMIALIYLKNIFSAQLPKMPKVSDQTLEGENKLARSCQSC